jgi:integrase/recombinase XerD
MVVRMREAGLRATGANAAIRAINAYLHWSNVGPDVKCSPSCKHPKIAPLKEPQNIPPTFTEQQVRLIVSFKAKTFYQRRVHLLALLLLDTGARISEALGVRVSDIDLDNLLLTLDGKGRKQRVVPFSFALRKVIHRFITDYPPAGPGNVFTTPAGRPWRRYTALRSVKALCSRLGFTPPPRTLHAFRQHADFLIMPTRYSKPALVAPETHWESA